MASDHYLDLNKDLWNSKVDVHVKSDFYDQKSFLEGRSSLNSIELDTLGEVKGQKILHLHCHFGQDSLSLARMGAEVTGTDFSAEALAVARETNTKLGMDAHFVEADTMNLPKDLLQGEYDWVFATYGVVGWLPDMALMMSQISKALKPGGRFLLVEFHPVIWMYDDNFTTIKYPYTSPDPIEIIEDGSYTDGDENVSGKTVSWNHGISQIITPLISNGLEILEFVEYDYSPYPCFSHITERSKGRYVISKFPEKVPHTYKICAQKPKRA